MGTMRPVKRSTNAPGGEPAAHGPPLALRMATEIALRAVPGRTVLLVGPPDPWVTAMVERHAGRVEVVPHPGAAGELVTKDTTFEVVVALRVLPFFGPDSRTSEQRARLLVATMAEKLVPGGTLVFDIDNPQSLRGAYFGVRHLAKAIEAGPLVADTPEGPNRFDTLERFMADLPDFLEFVELHGVELVHAPDRPRRLPLVGRALEWFEWRAGSLPLLRRVASHLVIVLRNAGGRRADR